MPETSLPDTAPDIAPDTEPDGATPQRDFESQYRRVFEAAGCRTQAELAALLGIRQSSISDARRRRSVPSDWLMKLLEEKQVNPDWIRGGATSKYLVPADGEPAPQARPLRECSSRELADELVRRALR